MRNLMWCAIGYASALLLAHWVLPYSLLLYLTAACAALCAFAFLLRGNVRKIMLILLVSAVLGFAWYWSYNYLFISPAEELVGSTLEVDARVVSYPKVDNNYSSVEIRLTEDWMPSAKTLVYDYEGKLGGLEPGDEIKAELQFLSAGMQNRDESDYYFSDGIHLRAYLASDMEITEHREYLFLYLPLRFANSLGNHILALFPDDVSPLMKALLTGDKTDFYNNDKLYCDMKATGFSHIIAVSGMHVSFIIGLIRIITGRRRMTAVIGIPLVWFFAAMSGLSPSVVRASLMISALLLAPILRRENDPLTSLSAALLLLTVINPISIASISLQLSFAAMAGIILITPRLYRYLNRLFEDVEGVLAGLLRAISATFSSSVGALVFTTPLIAIYFGSFPTYSMLTNLLCLWAMSAAFSTGYIACIIGAVFFPLGSALAWVIAWLPRYVIFTVGVIAELPHAVLSTRNNIVAWWLVFSYAVIIITYLCSPNGRYRPIIPICCCISAFLCVTLTVQTHPDKGLELNAVDVGQGQCIIVNDGNNTVMIDCGTKGLGSYAGDTAADFLLSHGRDSIDALILTHLHADHANGVVRLMNRIDVGCLVMPANCENTEYGDSILDLCYDRGVEVYSVSSDHVLRLGSLELEIYAPIGSADTNERGLFVLGSDRGFDFLVTGDAGAETEKLLSSFYEFGDLELLVIGHHGSAGSTSEEFLDYVTPEYAIISVGFNSYGHPSDELLERLVSRDIRVFRTDIDGTITISAGNKYG